MTPEWGFFPSDTMAVFLVYVCCYISTYPLGFSFSRLVSFRSKQLKSYCNFFLSFWEEDQWTTSVCDIDVYLLFPICSFCYFGSDLVFSSHDDSYCPVRHGLA